MSMEEMQPCCVLDIKKLRIMSKGIYELLRRKYPEREYALMEEVSDGAGLSRSRSADFILVNLWPSRGLSISGLELKSFRSDWLRELKMPEKAENIFKFCDYWWLITTDENIAKIEEIPPTWGWMAVKGERIIIKKEAPKLSPTPVTRNFLCAMLKRACSKDKYIRSDQIEEKIKAAKQEGLNERDWQNKRKLDRYEQTYKAVTDFEQASGIRISEYNGPKKMGEAVKFIMSGGTEGIEQKLIALKEQSERIVTEINRSLNIEIFQAS